MGSFSRHFERPALDHVDKGANVRGLSRRAWLAGLTALAACGRRQAPEGADAGGVAQAGDYQPSYAVQASAAAGAGELLFAVHPLHNPAKLFEVYGPLLDWLNRQLPEARLKLQASRNYEEFERQLQQRRFAFALPNPYQTLLAVQHGYRVFAKMGDDESFRGLLLLRRDGPVREIADLRGRAVSFPARSALAATMLPQDFLHRHGLPLTAYEQRYVGSQESAIMNTVLGNTAAASTWPLPWRAFQREHPEEAAQLVQAWQTDTLPNNALVARDDMPPALVARLRQLLLDLHHHAEGQALLARLPLSNFDAADEATYRPVQRFMDEFERSVRGAGQ
jgi:phosphonate transport system substrate-binding protein